MYKNQFIYHASVGEAVTPLSVFVAQLLQFLVWMRPLFPDHPEVHVYNASRTRLLYYTSLPNNYCWQPIGRTNFPISDPVNA